MGPADATKTVVSLVMITKQIGPADHDDSCPTSGYLITLLWYMNMTSQLETVIPTTGIASNLLPTILLIKYHSIYHIHFI